MKRQKVRSKMGVKEKALTAASSIARGDFLRMVTGGGASRKIDYSKLAKAIVEEYNGSTIAGSAQTLKVALDSLNSKLPVGFTLFEASTAGKTVTLGNGYRGVVFALDSSAARCGEFIIATTATGVVNIATILSAEQLTLDTSVNGKITIIPDTGARKIVFMTGSGDTPS